MKKEESIQVTFPVDFEILSADKKSLLSGIQEAFTTQVDREAVRVKFTPSEPGIVPKLTDPSSILSLIIHIPNYYKPLTAYGKAREVEKISSESFPQVLMAIELVEMPGKERKLLTEYAKWVKWRPRFLLLLSVVILTLAGSAIGYSYYLMKEDFRHRLSEKIRHAGVESQLAMKKLDDFLRENTRLEAEIMNLEQKMAERIANIDRTEKRVTEIKDPTREGERAELERKLGAAEKEKEELKAQVEALRKTQEKLEARIAAETEVPTETIRVTFKNGRTITGKLIESDENNIKLKIGYRPITLNRKLIQDVEFVTPGRQVKRHER